MTKLPFAKSLVLAAIVLMASLPARPAAAVSVGDVISALKSAYDAYNKYAGGELTLAQATDQMIGAINGAKTEILARIDGIAAAEGKACAKSTIILFADIELLTLDNQQALANDAVECLALLESLLETVEDKAAVDKLGFALNALAPIAMMARAYVGLPESAAISDMVINGNWAVIAKLHPPCVVMTLWGDSSGGTVEKNVRCTAYNGDRGWGFSWVGDPAFEQKKVQAEDTATRNTSRAIAQALLPVVPVPSTPLIRFVPPSSYDLPYKK